MCTSYYLEMCHKTCKNVQNLVQYRVIHKSLRDFRPLLYSSQDGHTEGEHVTRGRDTPSFCPTIQVLDMSKLGDAADVNPVIKFLPHTLHVCGRNLITGGTYELPSILCVLPVARSMFSIN